MAPYGHHQVTAKVYGGVVDELRQKTPIRFLFWTYRVMPREIGEPVVRAFEMRDEASKAEDQAIAELEELIVEARNKKALERIEKIPQLR